MFKTYLHKYKLGTIPGDQCTEWWTTKDWDEWAAYVAKLKARGDYGKDEEVTLSIWYDPGFDDMKVTGPSKMSYGYSILDLK